MRLFSTYIIPKGEELMFFESLSYFLSRINCFSAFINTAEEFPQPLSKEEEREIFERYKKNGDIEAKQKLITHNLRLVIHIVGKYAGGVRIEADDLISVGTIGLMKAIDSFDYDKGVQLVTYASRCIDNEILMLLRANKKYKENMSLGSVIGGDKDGNDFMLMDIIPSDDDLEEIADTNFMVDKIMKIVDSSLTKREREVIEKRYGLRGQRVLTQKELAKEMGISRSYVSRIEAKALQVIKNHLDIKI